ncbi:MobA/MobL family protein [Magnetospirillum sp. XM-1]|uniref:MobA/MobL family protein n=1 Tax=Magnetospirillum sp. XM-1 TaxID=1663591 RepID=UPI00156174BD|nr:MobA/MobL family protein [Magnetospirillum sp. XM-1]
MEVRIIGGRSATGAAAYRSTSAMTSALAAAAYRACDRLVGTRAADGLRRAHTWDYRSKTGLAWSEIMIPAGAPEWMRDRQRLWSAVDGTETRKDAQYARELLATLPRELPLEAAVTAFKDWVAENVVALGMVADICVHAYGTALDPHKPEQARRLREIVDRTWPIYDMPTNGMTPDKIPEGPHILRYPNGMQRVYQPHAHVMLTMRSLTKDGFGNKERAWNRHAQLYAWRQGWEEAYNALLAAHGSADILSSKATWKRELDAAHDAGDEAEAERLSQTFTPRTVDAGGGYYAALEGRPPHNPKQFKEMTPMDFNKAISEQKVKTQRALQGRDEVYEAAEFELLCDLQSSKTEADKAKAQNEQLANQLVAVEAKHDQAIARAETMETELKRAGDLLQDASKQKQRVQALERTCAEQASEVSRIRTDLDAARRQAEAAEQALCDEEMARTHAQSALREQNILLDNMADYVTGVHIDRPRIADDATAIGRLLTHAEEQGKRLRQAESAIKHLASGVSRLLRSAAQLLPAKVVNWLVKGWNHLVEAVRGDAPLVADLLPTSLDIELPDLSGAPTNQPTAAPAQPVTVAVRAPAQSLVQHSQKEPVSSEMAKPGALVLPPNATKHDVRAFYEKLVIAEENDTFWGHYEATEAAADEAERRGELDSPYHHALRQLNKHLGAISFDSEPSAQKVDIPAKRPTVSMDRPLSGPTTNRPAPASVVAPRPASNPASSQAPQPKPAIPSAAQLPQAKPPTGYKPPVR